jgi:hypothetical protein
LQTYPKKYISYPLFNTLNLNKENLTVHQIKHSYCNLTQSNRQNGKPLTTKNKLSEQSGAIFSSLKVLRCQPPSNKTTLNKHYAALVFFTLNFAHLNMMS